MDRPRISRLEWLAWLLLAVGLATIPTCRGCSASEVERMTAEDKQKHFAAGVVVGAVTHYLAGELLPRGTSPWKRLALELGITLAVAVGKEAYDRQDPERHSCEARDAIATLAGASVGVFAVEFVYRF